MHPIAEAEIMKTRTASVPAAAAAKSSALARRAPVADLRLSGTKGGAGPDSRQGLPAAHGATGRGQAVAGLVLADTSRPARMVKPFRAVRASRDAAGTCDRARRHGPCAQGAGGRWAKGDGDG